MTDAVHALKESNNFETKTLIDPVETRFHFTWESLNDVDSNISDNNWTSRNPPPVLDHLPDDDVVLNETLRNILLWSQRKSTTQEANHDDGKDDLLHPAVAEPEVHELQTDMAPVHVSHDDTYESQSSAPSSTRSPGRGHPLLTRLKQIRRDMTAKKESRSQAVRTGTDTLSESAPDKASLHSECVSCFDEFPTRDLIHLECSHNYCKACLREVVLNAMSTESAFPPKCCLSEVPVKTVLSCLSSEQRNAYKEKNAEYSIPAGHRWYCPEPSCSKWIKPEVLHRQRKHKQTCPHCKARICSVCRGLSHEGEEVCPEDFGMNATLEVAEAEGWRRCYSCRTMVELTAGCRHITCKCGAEFCYVCNARWPTCDCTEADKERRLQELRARRQAREQQVVEEDQEQAEADAMALADAEEIAEAIRQIEEMEREDAIRRVEEERLRQLEEELALALLEEARLVEEIAKREAEEQAELEYRRILLLSTKDECQAMMKILMQIIVFQQKAMTFDHADRAQTLMRGRLEDETKLQEEEVKLRGWLQHNFDRRQASLHAKQREELDRLNQQAEEENDELFMHITMYLRDKPNRASRENKMYETLAKQQKERQGLVESKNVKDNEKLEGRMKFEVEGIQKAMSMTREAAEIQYATSLNNLGHSVGCERRWFQLINRRRIEMMKEHRRLIIEQLEAQQEPVGLTEELAQLIEPKLPGLEEIHQRHNGVPVEEEAHRTEVDLKFQTVEQQAVLPELVPDTSASISRVQLQSSPIVTNPAIASSRQNGAGTDRYDVVTRAIPGSFPVTNDSPEAGTEWTMFNKTPKTARHISNAISTSAVMAMSFVIQGSDGVDDLPAGVSKGTSHNMFTANRLQNTLPQSGGHNKLVDNTSTSKEPNSAGRRSLFRNFRKPKSYSEEEIKRRMSACVGDGIGA